MSRGRSRALADALAWALSMLAGLAVSTRLAPFPWRGTPVASLVAIPVACFLFAAAPRLAHRRPSVSRLACLCAPLLLVPWTTTRIELVAALTVAASASAALRPRFWRGDDDDGGAWLARGLFALTCLDALHVVWIAWQVDAPFDPDGAYYYGLARHWVSTGRFEDHVLWNHLAPPSGVVVHAVGDYWQPLTSLLLTPPFVVLGPSHRVASTTIALVSMAGAIGLWHLVARTGLVRHRAIQVAVLVAYGSNRELQPFRIDAETQAVLSTLLVFALVALHHRRWAVALLVAALLPLTRTDGAFGAIAIAACVGWRAEPGERRRIAALALGLVGGFVLSNLVRFGTLVPPAAAQAPRLVSYGDLYAISPRLRSVPDQLVTIGSELPGQLSALANLLGTHGFVSGRGHAPLGALGAMLALAPRLSSLTPDVSHRARATTLAAVLLSLAVPVLLIVLGGPVFNTGRSLQGLIGAMHLAAAIGASTWLRTPRLSPSVSAFLGLALLGWCLALARHAQPSDDPRLELGRQVHSVSASLDGATVATPLSWWVGAETDALAVIHIGEPSSLELVALLDRHHPQRLVLRAGSVPEALAAIAPPDTFEQSRLGPYVVTPMERTPLVRVYRLERDDDGP